MPFGAWTETDWRIQSQRLSGQYLRQDDVATPSDVLLRAKAEARRLRSAVSLSKGSLTGKVLARGGRSLASTHFSSHIRNSSTSIGELQSSVDTVGALASPLNSCFDSDDNVLIRHSEITLQNWKKEGRTAFWLAGERSLYAGGPGGEFSFDDGVDHMTTTASMVLQRVENDDYSIAGITKESEDTDRRFSVSDAVQLISGGTVIGAVAEDMLRKLKTNGCRSGISRRYVVTYELYGKLAEKVRQVLEQMEDISKIEVERANLAVKLKAGNVDANSIARALGREEDQELVAKLKAAAEQMQEDEDQEIESREKLVAEIEAIVTRDDLTILLKDVLAVLERFRWQDMAMELRKWLAMGENSDTVMRRLLDDTVELQREAFSVLTLSKFLVDETLSSHVLLAARCLSDFHETIDREMRDILEQCGLDDSITVRMLSDVKNQMLVEGWTRQSSAMLEEGDSELRVTTPSDCRANSATGINVAELTEAQQMMVMEREGQRRIHRRVMSDLFAVIQEHKRKVEMNRSLYDHMLTTTLRDAAQEAGETPGADPGGTGARWVTFSVIQAGRKNIRRGSASPASQEQKSPDSYLQIAMQQHESEPPKPDIDFNEDLFGEDEPGADDGENEIENDAENGADAGGGKASKARTRKGRAKGAPGQRSITRKKTKREKPEKEPNAKKGPQRFQIGAIRLLQSGKAYMDEIIGAVAEKNMLEENALRTLKKLELQRKKVKGATEKLRADQMVRKSESSLSSRGSSKSGVSMRRSVPNAAEMDWLQMRRDWLCKDLNAKVVSVSLKDITPAEKAQGEKGDAAGSEAPAGLASGGGAGAAGTGDAGPQRIRSRRRAVLMEAQSAPNEDEGYEAQVPRALLQELATTRDLRTQELSKFLRLQEQVVQKVQDENGSHSWDFRLEAQYCLFLASPWTVILDRLEEDVGHFLNVVSSLEKLSLETQLDDICETLKDAREQAKEMHHAQDEVRRYRLSQNAVRTEIESREAVVQEARVQVEHLLTSLLQKIRKWMQQVAALDLDQIFEARATRQVRMQKMQQENGVVQKKITETAQSLTEVSNENEELLTEKAEAVKMVTSANFLSRAAANRRKALQETPDADQASQGGWSLGRQARQERRAG
ncbi:unnamed protein product [Effrenium voratum]|nr:unnamed protein product [Effrenium voratum]